MPDGSPSLDGPHSYSYFLVVHLFRLLYREVYLKKTTDYGLNRSKSDSWPPLEISLAGAMQVDGRHDEYPNFDRINRSVLIINLSRSLSPEVWAMNFVIPAPGRYVGYIAVDKSLYDLVIDEREEREKRKAVLAHEFLEVLFNICNYADEKVDGSRTVHGREEILSLMGAFEFGLPWMDGTAHMERLGPALRDLLVSSETIHRLIREYSDFGSIEIFKLRFIEALRIDRSLALTFLLRFAEHISLAINVPRRLCYDRLRETLNM